MKLRSDSVFLPLVKECAVPENIQTRPMEGHSKFRGGGGLISQKLRKVRDFTGLSRWLGAYKPKNLSLKGFGYFLEQNNTRNTTLYLDMHIHELNT